MKDAMDGTVAVQAGAPAWVSARWCSKRGRWATARILLGAAMGPFCLTVSFLDCGMVGEHTRSALGLRQILRQQRNLAPPVRRPQARKAERARRPAGRRGGADPPPRGASPPRWAEALPPSRPAGSRRVSAKFETATSIERSRAGLWCLGCLSFFFPSSPRRRMKSTALLLASPAPHRLPFGPDFAGLGLFELYNSGSGSHGHIIALGAANWAHCLGSVNTSQPRSSIRASPGVPTGHAFGNGRLCSDYIL